jgi:hypothetical protein
VLRIDGGGTDDHLGSVGPEEGDLLPGDLVRHGEDAPVPAPCGHYGEADAGVARCRLHDGASLRQGAVPFGGVDHRDCGAVLDAATGVEELELCEKLRGDVAADAVQANQRGVAHEIEQRVDSPDRRAWVGDAVDVDPGFHRQGLVAVHDDRQPGVMELRCDRGRALRAVGRVLADHADRAGDVCPQVSDRRRRDVPRCDVHTPSRSRRETLRDRGFVYHHQDVHSGPIMLRPGEVR